MTSSKVFEFKPVFHHNYNITFLFEQNGGRVHVRENTGAFDFYFPSKTSCVVRYSTCSVSMELESISLSSHDSRVTESQHTFIRRNGTINLTTRKTDELRKSQSSVFMTQVGTELIMYVPDPSRISYDHDVEEFDRMEAYSIYLKYREHSQEPNWRHIEKKNWPKSFRCDAMSLDMDKRSIIWAFPDITRLDLSQVKPSSFTYDQSVIDYSLIADFSTTLFPDFLYTCDSLNFDVQMVLAPSSFSVIRNTLKMDKDDPFLYRMAAFHDPRTTNASFIGTFENHKISQSPFTILLSIDVLKKTVCLNSKFGNNGILSDFKVHVDCRPVVDRDSNCAVVLSMTDPELLVICLDTFAHIKIDLEKWTTEGFTKRWEREKDGLCMFFLSDDRLFFFPRYKSSKYNRKIAGEEPSVPKSTLMNWGHLKRDVITPFLEEKRRS